MWAARRRITAGVWSTRTSRACSLHLFILLITVASTWADAVGPSCVGSSQCGPRQACYSGVCVCDYDLGSSNMPACTRRTGVSAPSPPHSTSAGEQGRQFGCADCHSSRPPVCLVPGQVVHLARRQQRFDCGAPSLCRAAPLLELRGPTNPGGCGDRLSRCLSFRALFNLVSATGGLAYGLSDIFFIEYIQGEAPR
jgi:hypothetical protein